MKLRAYFMNGVMALLAESLHTLCDIFISGCLLLATYYSRKRADSVDMFGYGRAENVVALAAATLFISFTSYKLYDGAIPRLFQPAEANYQNLGLALGVLGVSMLLATAPLVTLFRQKERGAAAKAQLTELIIDELGVAASSEAHAPRMRSNLPAPPASLIGRERELAELEGLEQLRNARLRPRRAAA